MLGIDLKLVQLISGDKGTRAGWIFKPGGMAKIAEYADGIGPHYSMLIKEASMPDGLQTTDMFKDARAAGLVIHPYTFRLDSGQIPAYAGDFETMLDIFYNQVGVDGVFSDFPDRVVRFLGEKD